MFTKRHEQELAEVRELTFELRSRFDEVIKELERIRATQARLEGNGPKSSATTRRTSKAASKAKAKSRSAKAADLGQAATARAKKRTGPKRARKLDSGSAGGYEADSALRPSAGATDEVDRKRTKRSGAKRRRRAEATASPGSDAEP